MQFSINREPGDIVKIIKCVRKLLKTQNIQTDIIEEAGTRLCDRNKCD